MSRSRYADFVKVDVLPLYETLQENGQGKLAGGSRIPSKRAITLTGSRKPLQARSSLLSSAYLGLARHLA